MIRRQVVAPFLLLLFCTTFGSAGDQSGTTVRDAVRLFRSQNEVGIIRGLADLVALPNIATNFDDMERNAKHLTEMLEDRRFEVQLLRASGGPPAIFGRRLVDGSDRTVVFYAHYDGQPVVPELWSSDPFKAMIRTGRVEAGAEEVSFDKIEAPINPEWRLYGRSASDDKVSIVALLTALDALDDAGVTPRINIKLLLDGEEEWSSPHMAEVLRRYKNLFTADLWVFCDGPMHQTRLPQVVFGVRGVTSVKITAYGAAVGLHSGHYGNWTPDPGMLLARLVTSMRDADGDVTIDGVDELVRPLGQTAREAIAAAPPVDEQLKNDLALAWTEGQPIPLAQRITRPGANLLGFSVGQVGEKAKNAISPIARAVDGFRLAVRRVFTSCMKSPMRRCDESTQRSCGSSGKWAILHSGLTWTCRCRGPWRESSTRRSMAPSFSPRAWVEACRSIFFPKSSAPPRSSSCRSPTTTTTNTRQTKTSESKTSGWASRSMRR
jgi:acetylornithine deacetylase/succinyl-diaminopimelate desuccinylase-like protein